MIFRRLLVPATALLLLGVTAAPASAAVSVAGNSVTGGSDDDAIVVSCASGFLTASGATGTGGTCAELTTLHVTPGAGVDTVDVSAVTEAHFRPRLLVYGWLNDGAADSYRGSPLADSVRADERDTVSTGEGNDSVQGGGRVDLGDGDDLVNTETFTGIVRGGSGEDRFIGRVVAGALHGDSGDDRFLMMLPLSEDPALIDGGSGFDTWESDVSARGGYDIDSFPDGTAITVTDTGATLVVPALGPETFTSGLASIDSIVFSLGGGAQEWTGSGFSGEQRIRGEGGADSLTGGTGDDQLLGGSGDDTITGNGGADRLSGGGGDDVINARDGVADTVDCGEGSDRVVADAVDRVVGCEVVDLPAVTPPVPPATTPETGAVAGPKKLSASAKGKKAKKQSAFTFSSPTAGATFQCAVDDGAFAACASPYRLKAKALKKLKPGKHTLQVRAVVGALADPTPSVATFKVKR